MTDEIKPTVVKTRQPQTSAEWAAGIPDQVTADVALEKLKEARDYSIDAVDAVMATLGSGTLPPPRDLLPSLYDARDKVEQGITTIGAMAERSPKALVSAQYVTLGRQVGARLIDESNAAMAKAKASESPVQLATQLASAGARVAERAAGFAFKLGGRILTPMELLLGAALLDELFNGGKLRRSLLGGKGRARG
jgi:hypothetical protein